MSIKIQINSREALERLIGNDTELEVELRNSIVRQFTKKHLKDIAQAELIQLATRAIQEEIRLEFFETIKTGSFGATKTVFKNEHLVKLREDLKSTASSVLGQIVADAIQEKKVSETINETLHYAAGLITEKLMPENLERRLDKMVDARLKEKLGLR